METSENYGDNMVGATFTVGGRVTLLTHFLTRPTLWISV